MSDSTIEQDAPPPVSSLRSRFEALAAQQNGGAGKNSAINPNNGPPKITSSFLAGGVDSKSAGNAGAARWRGNSSHSAVPSTSSLVGDSPPTPTVIVHEVAEPSRRVVSTPIHIPNNSITRSSSSSSLNASVYPQESNSGTDTCSPSLKRTGSLGLCSSSRVREMTPAKSNSPGEIGQVKPSIRAALERPAPPPPLGDAGNDDQPKPHRITPPVLPSRLRRHSLNVADGQIDVMNPFSTARPSSDSIGCTRKVPPPPPRSRPHSPLKQLSPTNSRSSDGASHSDPPISSLNPPPLPARNHIRRPSASPTASASQSSSSSPQSPAPPLPPRSPVGLSPENSVSQLSIPSSIHITKEDDPKTWQDVSVQQKHGSGTSSFDAERNRQVPNVQSPKLPARFVSQVPPPPPRLLPPATITNTEQTLTTTAPPPLPARPGGSPAGDDRPHFSNPGPPPRRVPPLPHANGTQDSHHITLTNSARAKISSVARLSTVSALFSQPTNDTSAEGTSKSGVRPPPKRTIAPGDALPPRREKSSSGSESDDDETGMSSRSTFGPSTSTMRKPSDDLPDSTRANRHPPSIDSYSSRPIHVPAPAGVVAVAGQYCVTAGDRTLTIHNLDQERSADPPVIIDLNKDVGLEWKVDKPRVTAMDFRPPPGSSVDGGRGGAGRYLWCGTRDGHLFEVDVWFGAVTDLRASAHTVGVQYIFHSGEWMVSIDENGKVLMFNLSTSTGHELGMGTTTPRVARIVDRQGFARVLRGRLWTSNGPGSSTAASTNGSASAGVVAKGPVVRIYDIAEEGLGMRSIIVQDPVGAVTSGTVLSSTPGMVYLGHEGGWVTIWNEDGGDTPTHVGTVKVSVTDVLALEGAGMRLWAGNRQGMVYAYDVKTKPWTVTNSWRAHGELPVTRLTVDTVAITQTQKLVVYSVGRDEHVKFWDGLLGQDWIESELLKREASFCTFRPLNILVCTWNVDDATPDMLTGAENNNFFKAHLQSMENPDIIIFGFQEVVDLEDHKITAKSVFMVKSKKRADGQISEKVSKHYRLWHDRLVLEIQRALPREGYIVQHTENLVGLFSCVFVRKELIPSMKDVAITTVKRGMNGLYGNKGAIVARFVVEDSSICFINCHLAAGQEHKRARNRDLVAILEEKSVFTASGNWLGYVGGGDGSMISDHEVCFLNGDLNYRIDLRREAVVSSIKSGEISYLLQHDQLLKEMSTNPGFRLQSFTEPAITFAPTYKYDRRSDEYDTSEKRRSPAWCDRILHRTRDPERVRNIFYRRYEPNISDHRPVCGGYVVEIKKVQHTERAKQLQIVKSLWVKEERRLLDKAQAFYLDGF